MSEAGHARVFEPEINGRLSAENQKYLKTVLRLRAGDFFPVTDGNGNEARATFDGKSGYAVKSSEQPEREIGFQIVLFPALLKGDANEWIIEKGVELGALTFAPLLCRRCVPGGVTAHKRARWEKIALAAMLQCGGCRLPVIGDLRPIEELPVATGTRPGFFLHEEPLGPPSRAFTDLRAASPRPAEIMIASGPEGGFTPEETALFLAKSWQPVQLGRRRLRAETAPPAALAAVLF
jgi:16S rRNA (uracil1498-N3)-methyltransferase